MIEFTLVSSLICYFSRLSSNFTECGCFWFQYFLILPIFDFNNFNGSCFRAKCAQICPKNAHISCQFNLKKNLYQAWSHIHLNFPCSLSRHTLTFYRMNNIGFFLHISSFPGVGVCNSPWYLQQFYPTEKELAFTVSDIATIGHYNTRGKKWKTVLRVENSTRSGLFQDNCLNFFVTEDDLRVGFKNIWSFGH